MRASARAISTALHVASQGMLYARATPRETNKALGCLPIRDLLVLMMIYCLITVSYDDIYYFLNDEQQYQNDVLYIAS